MTVEMARPRRKTKPPAARNKTQEVGAITIRMYDVGFGDCFLVSIPTPEGPKRILFDCGSIKAGERPVGEVVNQLLRDVTDDQGRPRIDVVVATHRHKDHVSGFGNPAWGQVEVSEVWMPWTEDPTDAEAKRIREVQSRLAAMLMDISETRLTMSPAASTDRPRLELMRDLALNALSNGEAMRTLHHGCKRSPGSVFF